MSLLDEKGRELAEKAFVAELQYGDPTIPEELSKAIGATSTTLQESYLTALRILRAARRAEVLLDRIVDGRQRGEKVMATETRIADVEH